MLHGVSHLALGGAERIAATVATSLAGEIDFTVCAVRGVADGSVGESLRRELLAHGVKLHCGPRVPMRFGGMITGAVTLARAIRATRPDLVHLHTEIPESSYATLLAVGPGLRRLPLIRTIHNSIFWRFWRPLGCWCDRQLAHGAVVGVSPAAVDAFVELRRDSGAPPSPVPPEVIYNGLRPRCEWRPLDRPENEPLRIVFGGRLENEKGADLLPEILKRTPLPPGRRALLDIFGSGAHAGMLRAFARTPPPGWNVNLHAPVPDFAARLHRYDLILVPSRHEGLGLVAIEAALAGMPIVATDAPGLRDVFPPNYPLLARIGDAASIATTLGRALAEKDQGSSIGRTAQAFASQHFDADTMVRRYRALYARLLPPHLYFA